MAQYPAAYNKSLPITKSDTVNFSLVPLFGRQDLTCDAVYVGGAGVVVAVYQDESTDAFTCIAGQTLPIRAKRINSTSTTATVMVALYAV